jgi:hypothetical protein
VKTIRTEELIRENDFVLELQVEKHIGAPDDPWCPSHPIHDAQRLYEARLAMKSHDWEAARRYGRLYRLEPVPVG